METCKECGIGDDELILTKCPICHQMICEDHKYVRSGRTFCSQYCGAMFFHGDDEDGVPDEE